MSDYDSGVWILLYIFKLFFMVLLFLIVKLRLGVAAIYILLMCTVWSGWESAHPQLAMFFFIAILVLTAASWVLTFVRFIRGQ